MVRSNNMVPNRHFHKDWQRFIKTNFDEVFKKRRRKLKRDKRALKLFPIPIRRPRPIVNCPTVKYHSKVRLGRGFTLKEVKTAKIAISLVRRLNLPLDYRRRNGSYESIQENARRIQSYCYKTECFFKSLKEKTQYVLDLKAFDKPKPPKPEMCSRKVTEEDRKFEAYKTLRLARGESKRKSRKLKRDKKKADLMDDKK